MRSTPHSTLIAQNSGSADAGYITTTASVSSIINWSMPKSIAHMEKM